MSAAERARPPEWLSLGAAETIQFRAAPSQNLLLAGIGGGMTGLLVVAVLVAAIGDIGTGRTLSFAGVVLVLGAIGGIYLFVNRWEYVVTSDSVYVRRGFASRETDRIGLDAVEGVALEQSWWQRLVNVGTIALATPDDAIRFVAIEDPRHVQDRLRTIVDAPAQTPY